MKIIDAHGAVSECPEELELVDLVSVLLVIVVRIIPKKACNTLL